MGSFQWSKSLFKRTFLSIKAPNNTIPNTNMIDPIVQIIVGIPILPRALS